MPPLTWTFGHNQAALRVDRDMSSAMSSPHRVADAAVWDSNAVNPVQIYHCNSVGGDWDLSSPAPLGFRSVSLLMPLLKAHLMIMAPISIKAHPCLPPPLGGP